MSAKAERLVNLIVYLLESPRPRSSDEIRRTVAGYDQPNEVSFRRMFERDKEELREMGIPLEREATDPLEEDFGYRIPKERYYLPDIRLEKDELAALWIAASLLKLPDPVTARTALLKLAGDLPVDDDRSALQWLTADVGMSIPGLARAFLAVAERRILDFGYRTSGGDVSDRRVEPYGLVNRRGVWYLVGRESAGGGEVKSFRFDRMSTEPRLQDPGSSGGEFEIPQEFRAAAALSAPPFVGEDPISVGVVEFDSSTAWRVERESPWVRLEPASDGSSLARVEITEISGFVSWVLSYGLGAEVLEPPEARAAILQRLEEICA